MKSQNWNIYKITIFNKLLCQTLRDGKEGKIHLQVYIFGREVELNQTLHQLVLLRQSGMSVRVRTELVVAEKINSELTRTWTNVIP